MLWKNGALRFGVVLSLATVAGFFTSQFRASQAEAAPASCNAIKPAISQRTYGLNRPRDFYELCINNEPDVCSDLQERLNIFRRPATIRDDVNAFYLGFDVPVGGWESAYYRPEDVPQDLPKGVGWVRTLTPRLVIDLNGDGQKEVFHRAYTSLGGVSSVMIIWTEFPPTDDPHFEQGVTLETDPYPHPADPTFMIGEVWPDNLREYINPGNSTSDITESMGRYFLVVVQPWNGNNNPVSRVFIAAMQDARTGRLVCRFDARYRVLRNP